MCSRAIRLNEYYKDKIGWEVRDVASTVTSGTNSPVEINRKFVNCVKKWQNKKGLTVDGIIGPSTYNEIVEAKLTPKQKAIRTILEPTIGQESAGSYWAINDDQEFKGGFVNHRAEGKIHIGLSFGIIQFTQDSGSLGKLLRACAIEDERLFKSIFGPTYDQLLDITTRAGDSGLETGRLRGPRVEKVPYIDANGIKKRADIWEDPWLGRFKRFGRVAKFQAVQRKLAVEDYLEPILDDLLDLGMRSENGVAAGFSGSVNRGPSGFSEWLVRRFRETDTAGVATDLEIIDRMSAVDERFETFKNALSWNDWEGWKYYES